MAYLRSLWCIIRMVVTRRFETGSRSGSRASSQGGPTAVIRTTTQMILEDLDAIIREILHDEVAALFQAQ